MDLFWRLRWARRAAAQDWNGPNAMLNVSAQHVWLGPGVTVVDHGASVVVVRGDQWILAGPDALLITPDGDQRDLREILRRAAELPRGVRVEL